jgi:DNA mismatch repair ATPase MutS
LGYLEELKLCSAVLSSVKLLPIDALPVGQVALDGSTLVNLNVLEGPGRFSFFFCFFSFFFLGSLLSLLDHTVTPQGARLMRQWIAAPLADTEAINHRLVAIDVLRSAENQVFYSD